MRAIIFSIILVWLGGSFVIWMIMKLAVLRERAKWEDAEFYKDVQNFRKMIAITGVRRDEKERQ